MSRPHWLTTCVAVAGVVTSLWLWRQNRALHDALDSAPKATAIDAHVDSTDPVTANESSLHPQLTRGPRIGGPPPVLVANAPVTDELKLDQRTRKLLAFTGVFGRHDGESEADYRARIGPVLTAGLVIPRIKEGEMRKDAESKANVTPEQSRALDHAFEKTYDQVLDYANKSIADGALSPYQHDLAGWLEFAGGLGGILNDSQGQIGQILSADQLKTMTASGFDWGEYLGTSAPWENLSAPPPPK